MTAADAWIGWLQASIVGAALVLLIVWAASRTVFKTVSRVVPDAYLAHTYRRLADTAEQALANQGRCHACRHAAAHVTWWCERQGQGCNWEPCYSKDQITKADLLAGRGPVGGWVLLPPTDATQRTANNPA